MIKNKNLRKRKYDYIVYKTTDLKTGKIYIGYDSYNRPSYFGSGKIIQRVIQKRFNDYMLNLNILFKRKEFKKYSHKLFKKEILESYDTFELMLEGEKFWISKLNSQNPDIGYNILGGGQGGDNFTNNPNKDLLKLRLSKRTYQYDLNGNFIRDYYSSREASKLTNIDRHTINSCCKNTKVMTAGGFFWSYYLLTDDQISKRIELINNNTPSLPTITYQYDLNGNFISEYTSIIMASKNTNIPLPAIIQSCQGKFKYRSGYIWSHSKIDNDEMMKRLNEIKNRKNNKRVVMQYDLNNNFIMEYDSLHIASKKTKINISCISACCHGYQKTAGGFFWTFKVV